MRGRYLSGAAEGGELLGDIWGKDEAQEGMNAFLEKHSADLNQFHLRDEAMLNTCQDDYAAGRNQSEKSPGPRASIRSEQEE